MDPNAALHRLRTLMGSPHTLDANEAAEVFEGLDQWLTNGGFLPTDWNATQAGDRAKLDGVITSAKMAIINDVLADEFNPYEMRGFSDLNDHVDANMYLEALADDFYAANQAIKAITEWIDTDGLLAAVALVVPVSRMEGWRKESQA